LWAESLAGIDGDQIKFGLSYCAQKHEWPPTTAEFLACCKALPRRTPRLENVPAKNIEEQKKKMAELMHTSMKKPAPKDHWRKVLATKGLPDISYKSALEALAIIDPYGDWRVTEMDVA
jgi:hypothetical protein